MDMNELKGKVLKVNLARPMKGPVQPMGNRAGVSPMYFSLYLKSLNEYQFGSQRNG